MHHTIIEKTGKEMKKGIFFINTLLLIISIFYILTTPAYASDGEVGVALSPMKEMMILNPGEKYESSFIISNPESSTENFYYEISVSPFYVTENYDSDFQNSTELNQITKWITLKETEGILAPNTSKTIEFVVDVPKEVPAGGQYAAILVQSKSYSNPGSADETGIQINQKLSIAHTIFAEITGTTKYGGEVTEMILPSFLFTGDIEGITAINNTGNVHGVASYTLQVFPLFSNEEVYTNEDNPVTKIILPNRTLYNTVAWTETPDMGIFNVIYTVEFEGVTTQVSKMVIKCPIWLLFIIIFVIMAIIIYFIAKARKRKDKKASAQQ